MPFAEEKMRHALRSTRSQRIHLRLRGFIPIPRSNRKCRKRGAILEQRRRPTVKFQSDFALSHVVATRFKHFLEALLSDVCSEAETHRLRCGRIVPRAFCQSQLRNPGDAVAHLRTILVHFHVTGRAAEDARLEELLSAWEI